MSLYDEALSAGAPSLVDQIRQRWGQYGDWKSADQDQVSDLARLLEANGITDLSQLQFSKHQWEDTVAEPVSDSNGGNPEQYKVTRDGYTVRYGGRDVGFLGDINRDGSLTPMGGGDSRANLTDEGSILGWSSRGGGHTNFRLTEDPKTGETVVAPSWGSGKATTYQDVRAVATLAAMAYGGYLYDGGAGAMGGMSAADAAATDAAMIDMGAGATNVGAGATEIGATGMSAAEQAAFLEANAGALAPGGEIATGYGTTWGVGADGLIGSGATMTADGVAIDQVMNTYPTPDTVPPTTPPPTTPTTPSTPVTPGTNTVTPPVTQTPTITPNIDPSKIGDWASLFNVLSGLYGLKLAGDAAEKSDPFGPYRAGYAEKLQRLEANPGLLKSTPGYLGGLDAIQRQMAAKGYLGSGNMAGALMRYSGDSYHNEANRLATLAGANIGPGQTYFNQAQLTGQSLSNIGYGLMPYMQGGPR